jgi:FKBP-type peptidyl-prolyl cis-trans isomerase FkpA
MRNLVWGFLGLVLLYGSCKKESGCGYSDHNVVAPLSEQQAVQAYLSSYSINSARKDSSGFYYEIIQDGTGGNPNLCSQVELTYTGKLTNGSVFANESTAFTLGSSIDGLKKGIRLIQKGGHMKLYIPPTLAYGSKEYKDNSGVTIPPNSILIFDVKLNAFY